MPQNPFSWSTKIYTVPGDGLQTCWACPSWPFCELVPSRPLNIWWPYIPETPPVNLPRFLLWSQDMASKNVGIAHHDCLRVFSTKTLYMVAIHLTHFIGLPRPKPTSKYAGTAFLCPQTVDVYLHKFILWSQIITWDTTSVGEMAMMRDRPGNPGQLVFIQFLRCGGYFSFPKRKQMQLPHLKTGKLQYKTFCV